MISVIVPVYNVEAYLEKSIRSILNNTFRDLELICINDGSPDSCLSILLKLAKEDPRIRIIDQKNQGVQLARNNGLSAAKGDYIAFVDPDDWVHPQYFQLLHDGAERFNADIVICDCQVVYKNDEIPMTECSSIQYHRMSDKQFFKSYYARHMCWGRLYRRDTICKTRFVQEVKLGEDTLFNLQVVSEIKKPNVYETKTPMYYYLQRSGSIVRKSTHEDFIKFPVWVQINCINNDKNDWSWMLLMQAVKYCLSYRYEAILRNNQEESIRANEVLNDLMMRLLKNQHISLKDKMIHMVMKTSPQIYRYFRIKNDPSMLIWEKTVNSGMSDSNRKYELDN